MARVHGRTRLTALVETAVHAIRKYGGPVMTAPLGIQADVPWGR